MKIFRTNQYNSLNIFNYVILCSFVAIVAHFFIDVQPFVIVPYIILGGTILLISFFTVDRKQKIDVQNNILQKSITFLAISLYVLVITTIFYFFIFSSPHRTYTRPNDYSKALQIIKQQDKISHFPKTIPLNAKKIQLYCYTS